MIEHTFTLKLTDKELEALKKAACRATWTDDQDTIIDDYAGGNIDDAYQGGVDDGETIAAQYLLTAIGVKWYG